jgi:hypothetical protein
MLTIVLLVLAAIVTVVLILAALRPAAMRVERHAVIAAAPADVFAEVNDFHRWLAWSPWEKMDPTMQRSFEGEATGPGAVYGWNGNRRVGSGRMTLLESRPAELIRIKLEFFKPMAGVCQAEFSFKPEGETTMITWSMTGKNSYLCRIVSLFISLDKMLGNQFEEGLTNLRRLAEAAPAR